MKKILFFLILTCFGTVIYAQSDCKIPSYLEKMGGFELASCKFSEFNEYEFTYNDLKGNYKTLKKSGVFYRLNYEKNENETREISGAQICKNYLNAVVKAKGENLSSDNDFFRFSNNGSNIWMKIDNAVDDNDQGFQIYIIEEAPLVQEIKLNIQEALKKDGKIALYGILFDYDKSVIKSESEPELTKLAEYLTANPTVNIFIIGHTDMSGDFAHNVSLSKSRAQAVKEYLVSKKGIASTRLIADGVGPMCPVSTNETEQGQKLNRRVEIVLKSR